MAIKYLLDTNVLIYLMLNDRRLGLGAQELLDRELDRCAVSVASLWEIAIKQRIRKLSLPAEVEDVLDELRVPILPIAAEHISRYKLLSEVGHATFLTTDKKLLSLAVPGLSVMNCRV